MGTNTLIETILGCSPPKVEKICRRCKELKDISAFNFHNATKDSLYPICKSCRKRVVREEREINFFKYIHTRKKSECKTKGINYNLDPEYLEEIWMGVCPVLGVELEVFERYSDNSYSLDKIRPDLGYIKGNVQFISNRANFLKGANTSETLKKLLEYTEKMFDKEVVWSSVDSEGNLL